MKKNYPIRLFIILTVIILIIILGIFFYYNLETKSNLVVIKMGYFSDETGKELGKCNVTITQLQNSPGVTKKILFYRPNGELIGECNEVSAPGTAQHCSGTCDSKELLQDLETEGCNHNLPKYSCTY
ncbi:MAG: hypothetical protein WC781_03135 [Candidatus Pacearchaeota archaeon]|jgi:hypothetical protein